MVDEEDANIAGESDTTVGVQSNGSATLEVSEQSSSQSPTPERSNKLESEKLIVEKLERLNVENDELRSQKQELLLKTENFEKIHSDLKTRLDRATATVENTKRELQSMVMKYATSEREVLNLKKHITESDKKFKESIKEREQLQLRIKDLTNDKKQLISSVERHVLESANLRTECDLAKNRLDQAQVREEKLQLSHQQLTYEYQQMKAKIDQIEAGIASLPKVSSIKYSLDDDDDVENDDISFSPKSDESSSKQPEQSPAKDTESEPSDYTALYVQCLEQNQRFAKEKNYLRNLNSDLERRIEELENNLAESSAHCDDYRRKAELIDTLKEELMNKQNVINSLKGKFDQINSINRSLVGDIDTSKNKESELLEYTERLTAKLVSLQSGSNTLEVQIKQLAEELEQIKQKHENVLDEKNKIQKEFEEYKTRNESLISELQQNTSESSDENERLKQRIDELENDIAIAKKKHVVALKEMSQELQSLRKQNQIQSMIQVQEKSNTNSVQTAESVSALSSRTGSISSLNNLDNGTNPTSSQQAQPQESMPNSNSEQPAQEPTPPESESGSSIVADSSTQNEIITSLSQVKKGVLIEKLLKLQRILVKRKEKIDFLEEHSSQLTDELKKKTKLLQQYILKEETGALSTDSMDQNKAYLSRRGGGIMASLYNSFSTDDSMTLERSLEINSKLHAVLEDTLLKNMTLKENLNTLAAEIARISSAQK